MPDFSSQWLYSTIHNSPCKVIEKQNLWGQTICRIWLPGSDAVVKVPQDSLQPLSVDLQQEIESARQIIPEIRPLLLPGIMGGGV